MKPHISSSVLLILVFVTGMTFSGVASASYPDMQRPDSLSIYYKALDLRAEGPYNTILTDRKHSSDRLAPLLLRAFIEKFEPQRLSFVQGVSNSDGKITFWWFLDGFAVKGDAAGFMVSAETFMKENDLGRADSLAEQGRRAYFLSEGKFNYIFELDNFTNYTGGPLCGGGLLLKIEFNSTFLEPLVGDMMKLYPAINCFVLPSKIEAELVKWKFTSISYGGTWENYYTWDADIKCLDEPEAAALNKKLTTLILASGYKFHEESGNTRTFILQDGNSPAFFYLTKDESIS
jgi:hypothetical protein